MKPCNITSRSLILHGSLRVIKLQPRFKVCNISYLCVLFHSSQLLFTFGYINHKKIKGKECIHLTISFTEYNRMSPGACICSRSGILKSHVSCICMSTILQKYKDPLSPGKKHRNVIFIRIEIFLISRHERVRITVLNFTFYNIVISWR